MSAKPITRKTVKSAAIRLAKKHGLINLTREAVAEECGFLADSFQHFAGITFSAMVANLQLEGHTGPLADVSRGRANPKLRKQQVLEAAVTVAKREGYQHLSRTAVAEAAGVSEALVSHYFGSLPKLQGCVMDYAIHNEVVAIVAQGLGASDESARGAPEHLKDKAVRFLANH